MRVDRTGREQPLPGLKADNYESIRVSPDGQRLLYDVGQPRDVWTYELARGMTDRLTSATGEDRYAIWTPDGTRVAYMSTRNGSPEIFWQPLGRSDDAAELLVPHQGAAPTRLQPEAWVNGTSTLIVTDAARGSYVAVVGLDGDRRVSALASQTPFIEGAPALSRNGRWIAYQSNVTGQFEGYVEQYPDGTNRQKISLDGGYAARWSPDGRELFYVATIGQRVVVVSISEQGSRGRGRSENLV